MKHGTLQIKPKNTAADFCSNLTHLYSEMKKHMLRAALVVFDKSEIILESELTKFIKDESSKSTNKKKCVLDFNIYKPQNTIVPNENTLKISFRMDQDSYVKPNDLLFGLKEMAQEFLICEMHLIYLFERVFFKVISDFGASLVMCLNNSQFTRNCRTDPQILNGDCNRARPGD